LTRCRSGEGLRHPFRPCETNFPDYIHFDAHGSLPKARI
jgi:hypothetical protein